ncbi:hypothetical protein ACFRFL_40275 [Streptomyces sp. NPDC056708]|uniref:hypothetical protein n=1 Tax=unclassified Streptomyces TaxID=2593676 RepID=UPI0036B62388
MDTTRRALLKGIAAVPLAVTAGGLLVPSVARAAEPGYGLRMYDRDGAPTGTTWAAATEGLITRQRLGVADLVDDVLDRAERRASAPRDWRDGPGSAPKPDRFDFAFGWDARSSYREDAHGKRWYPQGITTSHDAYGGSVPGSGGKTVALVSWYDKQTAGNQGAKVSVIDVTRTRSSSRPRYDHVLLVEPTKESGEPFDFKVTTLHAGGIAWVGKWLYVADRNRGLYVFDTTRMLKVSRGSTGETRERAKSWCGYHAGDKKYYAHGYRYVMPLHHVYRPAGWSANLAYSQVSLDRTQGAAQSLVVSEYFEKSRDGVAVRWNLNSAGYITAERAASTWPLRIARVQGAVCVGDRTYYSANAPVKPAAPKGPKQGSLWLQRPWGAKMTAPRGKLTLGPEDLSYQPRAGGGSLWCLAEHEDTRRVYRIRL